jgi:hypothetical protein
MKMPKINKFGKTNKYGTLLTPNNFWIGAKIRSNPEITKFQISELIERNRFFLRVLLILTSQDKNQGAASWLHLD